MPPHTLMRNLHLMTPNASDTRILSKNSVVRGRGTDQPHRPARGRSRPPHYLRRSERRQTRTWRRSGSAAPPAGAIQTIRGVQNTGHAGGAPHRVRVHFKEQLFADFAQALHRGGKGGHVLGGHDEGRLHRYTTRAPWGVCLICSPAQLCFICLVTFTRISIFYSSKGCAFHGAGNCEGNNSLPSSTRTLRNTETVILSRCHMGN